MIDPNMDKLFTIAQMPHHPDLCKKGDDYSSICRCHVALARQVVDVFCGLLWVLITLIVMCMV